MIAEPREASAFFAHEIRHEKIHVGSAKSTPIPNDALHHLFDAIGAVMAASKVWRLRQMHQCKFYT